MNNIATFIHFGNCNDEYEAIFCKYLSRLPVDVLIIEPNKNKECVLNDDKLKNIVYDESVSIETFPINENYTRVETQAHHFQDELNESFHNNLGLYKSKQFKKANILTLQSSYVDIHRFWNVELQIRENFSSVDDVVNLPVFFSKVSGVENGDIDNYWREIKSLFTDETVLITKPPYINVNSKSKFKQFPTDFIKIDESLQKAKIKNHKDYQYSFLRDEMQEHILNKLELLLKQRIIKGTFENGTQYTILSVCLNLNKEIIKLIHKFDFTKHNPKLVYIMTNETMPSLEDAIMCTFLHMIGFDVVFFVPTGYQCIERFFNQKIIEEHQIGEYIDDLHIPNFDNINLETKQSLFNNIFRRGK